MIDAWGPRMRHGFPDRHAAHVELKGESVGPGGRLSLHIKRRAQREQWLLLRRARLLRRALHGSSVGLGSFKPLEYRLMRTSQGVSFFNDSKATECRRHLRACLVGLSEGKRFFSCLGAMKQRYRARQGSSRPSRLPRDSLLGAGQRFFEALSPLDIPVELRTKRAYGPRQGDCARAAGHFDRAFSCCVRRLTNSTPSNTAAAFSSSSSTFAPSTRDGVEQTLPRPNIHGKKRHDEPRSDAAVRADGAACRPIS